MDVVERGYRKMIGMAEVGISCLAKMKKNKRR